MWPFKKKEPVIMPWVKILNEKKAEYDKESGEETKILNIYNSPCCLFNNKLKKMVFYRRVDEKYILIEKDFKDLIGCEYSKNNQVVGSASVTGAVVGGLLAGTTGAIIGAASGDKTYLSLELKMFFNDFDVPVEIFAYNNKGSKTADTTKIEKEYTDLYAMCQFIINQNKMNTN